MSTNPNSWCLKSWSSERSSESWNKFSMFPTSTQHWYFSYSPITECQASPPEPGRWRASVWCLHCTWPQVCPREVQGEGALPGLQPPERQNLSMNLSLWCPFELGCFLSPPTIPVFFWHRDQRPSPSHFTLWKREQQGKSMGKRVPCLWTLGMTKHGSGGQRTLNRC